MTKVACVNVRLRDLWPMWVALVALVLLPAAQATARAKPLKQRGERPRHSTGVAPGDAAPDRLDVTPPRVILRVPEHVDNPRFTIEVAARDASRVVLVQVALDGAVVAARTDPPYRFNITAPRLPVRVKALATDRYGNTGTAQAVVRGLPEPCTCPEIYAPVCGADGHTYGNACEARCAGVEVAHEGPCEQRPCGTRGAEPCPEGSFCEHPPGTCGAADQPGECRPRPQACPKNLDPVCGCDGRTYPNDCQRQAAGVSLGYPGSCDEPSMCGGIAGFTCEEGQVCDMRDPSCGVADLAGRCVPAPDACPRLWAPVCGCDGVTYPNDCERLRAGAVLARGGECEPQCRGPLPDWGTCETDDDCVIVDGIGCCPCMMGGRQGAVNAAHAGDVEQMRNRCCDDRIACPAVALCRPDVRAVCERGRCAARPEAP